MASATANSASALAAQVDCSKTGSSSTLPSNKCSPVAYHVSLNGSHRATTCSSLIFKPSFGRLRRSKPVFATAQETLISTSSQEVEFYWKGEAQEVLLTGSFLNWENKVTMAKVGDGTFVAKQKLKPGSYTYKFIVDGEWKHSPDSPTVSDGTGGFNNSMVVQASAEPKPEATPPAAPTPASAAAPAPETPPPGAASTPAPAPAASKSAEAPAPAVPAAKAAGKKAAGKKAAAKPIGPAMTEDIIPLLRTILEKEEGLSELELAFEDNQLRGSFLKNGVRYQFCAYFPDGKLEGSRGFSLTSRGNPFSTVEPFLIDERKITTELLVFWVQKRLFAQKLLSLN